MEVKLIIVRGKTNRAEVALKLPGTIGRSREADLTIAHAMISRQHCQLFDVDGLVKIRDLGSLNGTFVGQEQIQEADLPPDTEFSVGPVTFRVAYEYAGPTSETPELLPEPEPPPESAGVNEPDFLPAEEEPAVAASSEETPIAAEPAAASPSPPPPPRSVPIAGFDAGLPDLSGWTAAVQRQQADLPQDAFRPAPPAPVAQPIEQPPAEPPATEDESFVDDLLAAELPADEPLPPATEEQAIAEVPQAEPPVGEEPPVFTEPAIESLIEPAIEPPVGETPDEPMAEATAGSEETIAWLPEPPAAEVSAEPVEELIEALPSEPEPEPATAPAGDQSPATEAAEEEPASQAAGEEGGKKSRWWPFGRGKKKAKAETTQAVAPTAPAEAAAPTVPVEPASPPSFEPPPDFLAVPDGPPTSPAEEPVTDDEALNEFFKGLK